MLSTLKQRIVLETAVLSCFTVLSQKSCKKAALSTIIPSTTTLATRLCLHGIRCYRAVPQLWQVLGIPWIQPYCFVYYINLYLNSLKFVLLISMYTSHQVIELLHFETENVKPVIRSGEKNYCLHFPMHRQVIVD